MFGTFEINPKSKLSSFRTIFAGRNRKFVKGVTYDCTEVEAALLRDYKTAKGVNTFVITEDVVEVIIDIVDDPPKAPAPKKTAMAPKKRRKSARSKKAATGKGK